MCKEVTKIALHFSSHYYANTSISISCRFLGRHAPHAWWRSPGLKPLGILPNILIIIRLARTRRLSVAGIVRLARFILVS